MIRSVSGAIVILMILTLCACRKQEVTLPMPPAPKWKPNRDSVMAHPPKGMRLIKGGTFRMGGLDGPYDSLAEAKHIADSGMSVGISHQLPSHSVVVGDFFMDTAEVTEADWNALLGKPPGDRHGGAYPVLPSWYQAILFANAKSRRDGLKPVYSFSGCKIVERRYSKELVIKDSILTGLAVDMTANGYRLPTEAEYEYAEASGGDTDRPADNDSSLHPAAYGRPDSWGVHDLLDNFKEWVNDGYDENYYATSIRENPYGHDDTRTRGIALMEAGVPEPGIFTARSDLAVMRGPELNVPGSITRRVRNRQYSDPDDRGSFRTVLQVR
ncbi:MAG: SUMF1/EgtB/PvdO family nonheme iron enzyme [Fibrobacteres bacterium]|jgi:formylglycine-generating enzyme required for sulfatase activity|nr:SUMF1/EgtB/PvdO family nonheme iron enzyme [Fibrobacterota bacterium]